MPERDHAPAIEDSVRVAPRIGTCSSVAGVPVLLRVLRSDRDRRMFLSERVREFVQLWLGIQTRKQVFQRVSRKTQPGRSYRDLGSQVGDSLRRMLEACRFDLLNGLAGLYG